MSQKQAKDIVADWAIGTTSIQYETGGRGVTTISSGKGDNGGASYGAYQLSSATGTLDKYLNDAKYGNYSQYFIGLKVGSSEFNSKWEDLAKNDPYFASSQHDFIQDTHYSVLVNKLTTDNLDLSKRGIAVKDMLWSTSVQFGGGTSLVKNAIYATYGKDIDVASLSDANIISAVQDYKIKNNDTLFKSSSDAVRKGTLSRAISEKDSLLNLISIEDSAKVNSSAIGTVSSNENVTGISMASFSTAGGDGGDSFSIISDVNSGETDVLFRNNSSDFLIGNIKSNNDVFDCDRNFYSQYRAGNLTVDAWNFWTSWSTSQLVNVTPTNNFTYTPGYTYVPTFTLPNLSPIGAFYESKSAGNDPALSIASKTFRIFNSANQALSAAQLSALDTNKDGQLTGAELSGLNAWSDLNEDGILNAGEMTSLRMALANAGLSSLRSTDYAFYTAGNANARSVAENTATAPVNSLAAPAVPASNYTTLRYNDNHRTVSMGTIVDQYISINGGTPIPWKTHYGETQWYDWNTGQIKQTNDNTSLVGTEGNDNFDANYYSGVSWLPSGGLINFYGGGGNDVMGGSGHDDNLWGGTGNDTLFGYDGDDHLYGEDGADELQGGNGNDVLDGGTGDDRLFGQVGNDTLNGGDGNDLMMGFTATNEAKQTLSAGETDNDIMFGGNGNDQMYGGLGDDYMDGGNDNDLVVGGDGNDTLFGGAGDDEVSGGDGNDVLDGGTGADKLFGGIGNDRMWGGDGNDIMVGFNPTNDSKQTLAAGETDDDVMYGGAGDDLMLGGLGNDQLWGGIGNDEVQGGDGNDQIYGEDGNDRLFGGAGNDIIYGGNGDDLIVGGAATNETALAAGTADNNFLYGGAGNDTILGGIGNDYIDGGAGADNMQGGQGDDIYIVNSVNDVILEQQNEGYDTVISSSNYILNANIEELRLTEGGSYNGTGNSLNNKIIGNSQDNILDGVTGADTMIGGLGNDTYYVDNAGDQVIELAGEGIDTVQSSISYTLGDNVENLNLLDFSKAEKGIADGVDILVYGYPKANELDYMQGNAVAGYKGTCALTSIANLATQANQALSEAQVVQKAIDNQWCVTDPAKTDYQRGGSNYVGQQALLDSYGIRNGIIMGFNEQAVANLLKGGRGVIIGVNAGKLWGDNNYLDDGGINHVVTVTGVACNAQTGEITGFYIADSGRGLVSDMTRYVSLADFRNDANVTNAYAIYTIDPIKFWEENIDATGNALDNTLIGNRGNNVITGGQGNDTLIGQAGDDTYVFNAGDGHDTISDSDGHDVIRFGAGIRASDIQITRSGSVMTLSLNANDSIALATANGLEIEEVQFADGVKWYATEDGTGFNAKLSGSVSVQGVTSQGQILQASNNLSDPDGLGLLSHQWQCSSDGVNWSDIAGETGDLMMLTQAQVGKKLRVQVSYVDGRGNKESAVSAITDTVTNVNDAPMGEITIIGSVVQGEVLSALSTLTDADGLGDLRYQWQASTDGIAWADISNANNSTLTLGVDQIGKRVRAAVSYVDGEGTWEHVLSGIVGLVSAKMEKTLDKLTALELSSMSTEQIQALTAQQLQTLGFNAANHPDNVPDLFGFLNQLLPSQLSYVPAAVFGANGSWGGEKYSSGFYGALTAAQLSQFSSFNLQWWYPEQVKQLNAEAFAGLSVDQIKDWGKGRSAHSTILSSISAAQAHYLSQSVIAALDASDRDLLQASGALVVQVHSSSGNSLNLSQMTPQQLSALSVDQIQSLTAQQLQSINLDPLKYSENVSDLFPFLNKLLPAQIPYVPEQVFAVDDSWGGEMYQSSFYGALTAGQLGQFTANNLQWWYPDQVKQLNDSAFSGLSAAQLALWGNGRHAHETILSALTAAQVAVLSPAVLASMNTADRQLLINSGALKASPSIDSATSVLDLSQMTPQQLSALTITQIQSLTAQQLQHINLDPAKYSSNVSDLFPFLSKLLPAQLPFVPAKVFAVNDSWGGEMYAAEFYQAITANQLAQFTTDNMQWWYKTQADTVNVDAFAGLSAAQLSAWGRNRNQHQDILSSLSSRQLSVLSADAIAGMQSDDFYSFTTEQVSHLDADKLTGTQLDWSDAEGHTILFGLTHNQIAELSPESLSQMTLTQWSSVNRFGEHIISDLGANVRDVGGGGLTSTLAMQMTSSLIQMMSATSANALSSAQLDFKDANGHTLRQDLSPMLTSVH
ncbi:hypothetical protein [Herbaspirillum rubrisubalbicans]|uniref:VgrG-related protein n=1 Tax=Herbaspirillum rubrisubalbicans TaxID=80842 RepID=UPI0020A61E98|nr:hypothetical protein [Herbaspirillum rubrisubalbicans]